MNGPTLHRLVASATLAGVALLFLTAATLRPVARPMPNHADSRAGSGWMIVTAPSDYATLNSLGVVSPSDIWAAGYLYDFNRSAYDPATYHWDGAAWSSVQTSLASQGYDAFNGIAGSAHDDVWGVGYWTPVYYTYAYNPLIEHFDGSTWKVVSVHEDPSLDAGTLNGVSVLSRQDAWAVGYDDGYHAIIGHWDGTSWTLTNPLGRTLAQLYAVKALSSTNVWAAGDIVDGKSRVVPLILHWDGTQWNVVPVPKTDLKDGQLNALAFSADASTGFAVGVQDKPYAKHTKPYRALALGWNGNAWTLSQTQHIPWAFLYGVCVDHRGTAWAVGYTNNGPAPLFERWNGSMWRRQNVLPSTANGVITAIADDGKYTWAVGWSSAQIGGALIMRR